MMLRALLCLLTIAMSAQFGEAGARVGCVLVFITQSLSVHSRTICAFCAFLLERTVAITSRLTRSAHGALGFFGS